ncbi:hypothetical protein GQ600_25355 [Phytophthora cactorum]|nr:hypothetical protein GQ600_25355 [Phytophthora cactorum]
MEEDWNINGWLDNLALNDGNLEMRFLVPVLSSSFSIVACTYLLQCYRSAEYFCSTLLLVSTLFDFGEVLRYKVMCY